MVFKKGKNHTEETIELMKQNHKRPWLGKTLTEEHKEKKKIAMKRWWAEHRNNSEILERNKKISKNRKGILHTDEAKKKISEGHLGFKHTQESKDKMSESKKGHIFSEEHNQKISEARKGIHLSDITKQKLSLITKERWKDKEYRKKCYETKKRLFAEGKIKSSFLGKHHSEESKRKLSLSHLGKTSWLGRKHSEESKKKIRLAKFGKPNFKIREIPKSEEQKIKQSKTMEKLYSEGKIKCWNKGLTKETDKRVLNYSIKLIGKNAGEKNHLFNNWSSLKPYTKDFNKKFKRAIKERDGCCMLCNVSFEDLKLLKRQVHIHHIDYNKLNSFPQNCISMCNSCHSKVNFNRNQWIVFFQSLLKERYGYQYSEDQKIIFDFNFENQEKGGVTKC